MNSRDILTEYGLKPNRALGQNFLIDEAMIERIVAAAAEPKLPILEIGPGLGAITEPLSRTHLPIAAVELDSVLCGILKERLPLVTVINADFLKVDLDNIHSELGNGGLCVVGNLPYYITSPITSRLMLSGLPIGRMVLMMQEEAAERFTACPGDKNYVPLTVYTRILYDVSTLCSLSPACYYPSPDVSSAVLLFSPKGRKLPEKLPQLVKCAFSMRRKTLQNNLKALGLKKDEAEELILSAGLSPSVRAETLDENAFLLLSRLYEEKLNER